MKRLKLHFIDVCGLFFVLVGVMCILIFTYEQYRVVQLSSNVINDFMEQVQKKHEDEEYGQMQISQNGLSIDGKVFIGIIEIESIEVSVPVQLELSNANLKVSPCVYEGNLNGNRFIIAGHNYRTQFGKLRHLNTGDEIILTDIEGNIFVYQVTKKEILDSDEVESMQEGNWDLTLFTCTVGGRQRITIRCKRKELYEILC